MHSTRAQNTDRVMSPPRTERRIGAGPDTYWSRDVVLSLQANVGRRPHLVREHPDGVGGQVGVDGLALGSAQG